MSIYGQTTDLAINLQNSFGTELVSSLYFMPFLNESIALDKPPLVSEAMRGVFDEGDDYEGPNSVAGDVEVEAQPIELGVILRALCGAPTTVTSTGVYAHTFEPRTADFDQLSANDPITVYKFFNDSGSAQLFYDCNASALELSVANGEFLKMKMSVVGANWKQSVGVAAAYPVGKRLTWDISSVSIGGAAVPEISALTIALDDGGLEAMHTLNNSKFPSRIKRAGARTISVDGTFKFDNQDEFQQFISQSERELVLHFESAVEIQSGYNEAFTMKLPLLRYNEAKPTAGGPGPVEMAVTAKGKYSVNSATSIQFILVNTQAAY